MAAYLQQRMGSWELALYTASSTCSVDGRSDPTVERALDKALHEASLKCEPRRCDTHNGGSAQKQSSQRRRK